MWSTVIQWTFILAGIVGYFVYSQRKSPAVQQLVEKTKGKPKDLLDVDTSGTEKKKKSKSQPKKDKKPKPAKDAAVPKVTLENEEGKGSISSSIETLQEDDESLQRL